MILRPLFTYASPIWANAAKTHKKPIITYQNTTAAQMTDARWYIRRKNILKDLKIENILDYLNNLNKKCITRCLEPDSNLKTEFYNALTARECEERTKIYLIKNNPDLQNLVTTFLNNYRQNQDYGRTLFPP